MVCKTLYFFNIKKSKAINNDQFLYIFNLNGFYFNMLNAYNLSPVSTQIKLELYYVRFSICTVLNSGDSYLVGNVI